MATKDTRSNKPIKSWFITFPQSGDYTLQYVLEKFSAFKVQYAKLVKELHQDGNPHLHIVIQYATPHTKNAILAQLKVKFPDDWKRIHIQSLGSKSMADVYLAKDAVDTLEVGNYEGKKKKEKPMPYWIKEAMEKPEPIDIFMEELKRQAIVDRHVAQKQNAIFCKLRCLNQFRLKYCPWELHIVPLGK